MRPVIGIIAASMTFLSAATAFAQPALIGKIEITGSSAGEGMDLSGLFGNLESGVPKAVLGGMGSGIAYAGDNTLLTLPDRGPNAKEYNGKIDNTTSYIPRFNTLKLDFKPAPAGSALPLAATATIEKTTLLYNPTQLVYGAGTGLDVGNGAPSENAAGKFYFSGRSDNFDASKNSCNPDNARFDSEGIRLSADGKTVYISDEYGPYLYGFDRETGARSKAFSLPDNLCAAKLGPVGDDEIAANTAGRTSNKGMEGLAITPDGKTLVGAMQAALIQDAKDAKKLVRLVTVDIATGKTREFAYKLTDGSGISEILAVNNHQFLVDERDGKGLGDESDAKAKKLFLIDLDGAKDVTDMPAKDAKAVAVKKVEFLDLVSALATAGITPDKTPSKIEGIAFGPDATVDGKTMHTLLVANDNDFVAEDSGPNLIYVFGITDADLPGIKE